MVVMYITGLAVVLLLGVLLEQVIVNQLRPTMGRLLLIEGTVVLLMFFFSYRYTMNALKLVNGFTD